MPSFQFGSALLAATLLSVAPLQAGAAAKPAASPAVGPQYDTTHVYVATADYDRFVDSFVATFGGQPSKRITANVLPVPSSTEAQYVWTPVGTLSTFAFQTPIPYPFGAERNGYLVSDMDQAIAAARGAGAAVIVAPFKDPIGLDAVVEWPGGVMMQLYWHFTAPSYGNLDSIPDNRIYLSPDAAAAFIKSFLAFSKGRIVADDKNADGSDIGRPGEHYRRVGIESGFGRMLLLVTDGHLPWPFGREMTGYEVKDLDQTLTKAKTAGATVAFAAVDSNGRRSAVVQFPGGYLAEIHQLKAP